MYNLFTMATFSTLAVSSYSLLLEAYCKKTQSIQKLKV